MVKQTIDERRQYIRAKHVLSMEYRIVKSRRKTFDDEWHLTTTENMSVGGLAFYSDVDARLEDTLEIKVTMSGILDIYTGYGRVVRYFKKKNAAFAAIGIKFTEKKKTSRRSAKSYDLAKKRI